MKKILISAYYLTDRHPDGGIVKVVNMNNETATVYYVFDRSKKQFTVKVSDLYFDED
nr:MAG TPA: hypothetical protein [Caudoviricetes sp.]